MTGAMAERFAEITPELAEWWREQPMFFVATAPASDDGHVNVSPKGYDTLRVLGPHRVAYLDLTGSGVETIAHLRENGRITLMVVRVRGQPAHRRGSTARGTVHPVGSRRVRASSRGEFPSCPGARVDHRRRRSTRVTTSCGYAVPLMDLVERPRPAASTGRDAKGDDGLVEYRATKNAASIDGLPGLGA